MVRLLLVLIGLALATPAAATADIRLEVEATPRAPYLQAEVIYTVRLWRTSGLQHGYVVLPEMPGFIVEPLGETEGSVTADGRKWRVTERRLALFPQRSGRLEIPPPVFSGRESFLRGEALPLEVRPKPPAAGPGWWAPARRLSLREDWPDGAAVAGRPVERVLTVTAEGLTGAQLPPLQLPEADGLRALPGAVTTRTEYVDGVLTGTRIEHQLVVPQRPGALTLPPVVVDWWHTGADAPRRAEVPARTFTASAAAAPPPATLAPTLPPVPQPEPRPVWPLAAVALVSAVAAAAGLVALRLRAQPARRGREERALRRAVARACRAGDAAAARRALRDWAAAHKTDLAALARGTPAAAAALADLDRTLFGPQARAWNGDALRRHLLPLLKSAARRRSPPPPALPDLVP